MTECATIRASGWGFEHCNNGFCRQDLSGKPQYCSPQMSGTETGDAGYSARRQPTLVKWVRKLFQPVIFSMKYSLPHKQAHVCNATMTRFTG